LPPPVASFGIGAPSCEEQPIAFTSSSSTPVGSLTTWTWDFADGSSPDIRADENVFNHTFLNSGLYNVTLVVRTSDGCNSSPFPLPVNVSPKPVPGFTFPPVACLPNASVQFTNTSTPGIYTWNFGEPSSGTLNTSSALNPVHVYSSPGPFDVRLQVRDALGCIQETTIPVNTIHPAAIAAFNSDKPEVCIGTGVTFSDASNPVEGTITSWHWDFGDGEVSADVAPPVHLYNAADDYTVSLYIINSIGCSSDTLRKVFNVHPFPVVDAGPDRNVLEDGTIVLQPDVTGNDLSYLWIPDTYLNDNTSATPSSSPEEDITYTLTVTGRGGCSDDDQVFVKVLLGPEIPNTITPNGDNIHDKWVIRYLDTYPDNRVQVFTRTGKLVFESRGYRTPWDGTLNGKPLPIDTYYYIIEPGNGRKPMTGYVTILK
jgi:gliding motility-associated-like protein